MSSDPEPSPKGLSASPVKEINRLHEEILQIHQAATKNLTERAIRIGELLTKQKAKLRHGQWLPWIKRNLRLSEDWAQSYMRVYKYRDKLPNTETSRYFSDLAALVSTIGSSVKVVVTCEEVPVTAISYPGPSTTIEAAAISYPGPDHEVTPETDPETNCCASAEALCLRPHHRKNVQPESPESNGFPPESDEGPSTQIIDWAAQEGLESLLWQKIEDRVVPFWEELLESVEEEEAEHLLVTIYNYLHKYEFEKKGGPLK